MVKAKQTVCALCMLCLLGFMALGCEKDKEQYVAPPPPSVTVAVPEIRDVTDYVYYTGSTTSSDDVDIRARVEGFLNSMHFSPGEVVKKGDLLFIIDPRPFEAKVHQAEADLATAKAEASQARATLKRKEGAFREKAVSEIEVIQARADLAKAQAGIKGAEANLESAQIDLAYTKVISPLDGRITRNLVDIGNLVGSGEATVLANIVANHPIYLYFNVSETDMLRFKQSIRDEIAESGSGGAREVPVFIGLSTETGHPHKGEIDYVDNKVDTDTGTIQVRAVFQNDDNFLVGGLFARVKVPTGVSKDALLVPESALGTDQRGKYLLVVDDKNEVQYKPVETGALENGMIVIQKGLAKGENVIVKGIQRVRPGSKVTPHTAEEAKQAEQAAQAKQAEGDTKASDKE